MMSKFEASLINLDIENTINTCKKLIESSKVTTGAILRVIGSALDVIGHKYEIGEYFLSELIIAGEIVKEVMNLIEPLYEKDEQEIKSIVVLATVRGDLHDIGKNIVRMLLQFSGFKVIDLGVDVSAEDIAKAVKDNSANILGLSSLLTTTLPEIENVVRKLKIMGLRNRVKIIIGGAAVNAEVGKRYDVDAWAKTAVEGLKICKQDVVQERS